MVAKLKNEVVVKENFTKYKIAAKHVRKHVGASNLVFLLDYGDKLALHKVVSEWKSGQSRCDRIVISKRKGWNVYTKTLRGGGIRNQSNKREIYGRFLDKKSHHYRANRVLKQFCKRNGVDIKFHEHFDANILQMCYPALRNMEYKMFNREIPGCIAQYLRESNWKNIIHKCFGSKGKSFTKKVLQNISDNGFDVMLVGYLFKKITPIDHFHKFLDNIMFDRSLPENRYRHKSFRFCHWEYEDRHDDLYIRDIRNMLKSTSELTRKNVLIGLSSSNVNYLLDICRMTRDSEHGVDLDPNRNYSNITDFHHDIVQLHRRQKTKDYDFNHSEIQTKINNHTFDDYEIIIPQTYHELRSWGDQMNNCIGSYASAQNKGLCDLLAVTRNNKMVANLEIRNNQLLQIVGKCNRSLDEQEENLITNELGRFYDGIDA